MSFDIALTGLNAANQQLNTVGNNIANSGTVGFKSSRVNFGSLYADTQAMGVEVLNQTQSITQGGPVVTTNRSLDLAISGGGFFVTKATSGDISYTRAGVFERDKNNYIVNNLGQRLQGYPIDANGNLQTGTITDLQLQSASLPAKATDSLSFVANLNSDMKVPVDGTGAPLAFNPTDPNSYNSTYTTQIYDSLGRAHSLTQYFVKQPGSNLWYVHYYVDDVALSGPHGVQFDTEGNIAAGGKATLGAHPASIPTLVGAEPIVIDLDYTGTTQFGSPFAVTTNAASGYAAGEQTGLVIEKDGSVYASYSNGQRLLQGQVVLATFANPEGLKNVSGTAWVETADSGVALYGVPGVGQLGILNAGALESSNVDLTRELVSLMEGQRNYQANTKVISTDKELTQVLFSAI